jgi:serine/threonine-protein kinase
MARFLRFAAEQALDGNGGQLKEGVIGAEVFDRATGYDPRLDPIVRVEARRLRAKLCAYYEGPGHTDSLVIEFPKGGYAPVFRLAQDHAPPPVTLAPARNAIAVLPFENLSADPDNTYFSDGVTEEIIHALTRIPNLRVVAWNTASRLRDQQDDMRALRQTLHVAHALRGSVRMSGDRLRVSAYLIDTGAGEYIWSQTYDRQLCDVFAIQQEIASSIASALRLKFAATGYIERDVESYQLCLRGRFHARERTPDGLRRSIACFERAIAIDPNSALAHAGLADTWTLFADYAVAWPHECIPNARAAAQRALELDPFSAEAYAALGLIQALYDWRWEESERAFRRALELNPGYANAHHWLAVDHLAMVGRFEEARAHVNIAAGMDPLSPIIPEGAAFLYTLARRYDDALTAFARLIETHPSFHKGYSSSGRALLLQGKPREAIAMLEQGIAQAGRIPSIVGALGEAHGRLGNHAQARCILGELKALAARQPVYSVAYAIVHLGLGEKEAALDHLERGVSLHELQMAALNIHPVFDDLRGEPRFRELIRRTGFLP